MTDAMDAQQTPAPLRALPSRLIAALQDDLLAPPSGPERERFTAFPSRLQEHLSRS